jgi:hypothetical protein
MEIVPPGILLPTVLPPLREMDPPTPLFIESPPTTEMDPPLSYIPSPALSNIFPPCAPDPDARLNDPPTPDLRVANDEPETTEISPDSDEALVPARRESDPEAPLTLLPVSNLIPPEEAVSLAALFKSIGPLPLNNCIEVDDINTSPPIPELSEKVLTTKFPRDGLTITDPPGPRGLSPVVKLISPIVYFPCSSAPTRFPVDMSIEPVDVEEEPEDKATEPLLDLSVSADEIYTDPEPPTSLEPLFTVTLPPVPSVE